MEKLDNTTEKLLNVLKEDVKQFIRNYSAEFASVDNMKSERLTAKQIDNLTYSYYFDLRDETKNTIQKHTIGANTYEHTLHSSLVIYDKLCKASGVKQDKFQVVTKTTYRKNASGMSVIDFTTETKKSYEPEKATDYVFMNAMTETAIATNNYKLIMSPTEYNGQHGLYDKAGKKAEINSTFPKTDFLSERDYSPLKTSEKAPYYAKYGMVKLKDAKRQRTSNDLFVAIGQDNDGTTIFIGDKNLPTLKKCGFDGWHVTQLFPTRHVIKKEFADGTIVLLVCYSDNSHNNDPFYLS